MCELNAGKYLLNLHSFSLPRKSDNKRSFGNFMAYPINVWAEIRLLFLNYLVESVKVVGT